MNSRFTLAWLAVFVAWMGGSFLVHGMLLLPDYDALPALFRPQAESTGTLMILMLAAHVVMSGAFVWIYSRGVESTPWVGQGLRFGLAVALLAAIPTYTIYYVVQPMPGMLAVKQSAFDGMLLLILGAIVAWFYRKPAAG